jgi:outer membrane protein OmpA-like peptidoglycan-associated protein
VVAALGLWALLATVPARADVVDVTLTPKAVLGEGLPTIHVRILEPLASFTVSLTRSDGHAVKHTGKGAPGTTVDLPLPQPEGSFRYEGTLEATYPQGDRGTMNLSFETALLPRLTISMRKEEVDLGARVLRFRLSRPAKKATVKVVMDTGKVALEQEVAFQGESAGTPLELRWPEAEGRVLKIALRAYDTSDFYAGVEIFPWQIEIPHEEVTFDSAKAAIRARERPKLDESLVHIAEAMRKFGHLAELKLFVAGHTDTVGPSAKNRALSFERAKAIGTYFQKRGLKVPVFYEGFGEEALAVGTSDETAEVKNRRAEYIIAVDRPTVRNAPFEPSWQRLCSKGVPCD